MLDARRNRELAPVLVVDPSERSTSALTQSFRKLGVEVWLAEDFEWAERALCLLRPSLIVTELEIGGATAFDFVARLPARAARPLVTVATYHPSIESAVHAVRAGIDGYLAKPVNARLVLNSVGMRPPQRGEVEAEPTGLDRTIWDYLNQVYVEAGSMSEAARRIGLDRRSLRRMLNRDRP